MFNFKLDLKGFLDSILEKWSDWRQACKIQECRRLAYEAEVTMLKLKINRKDKQKILVRLNRIQNI